MYIFEHLSLHIHFRAFKPSYTILSIFYLLGDGGNLLVDGGNLLGDGDDLLDDGGDLLGDGGDLLADGVN